MTRRHLDPRERERMDELLALDAVEGLSSDDAAELDALIEAAGDVDRTAWERAAAALALADPGDGAEEPMPADLRARIEAAAPAILSESATGETGAATTPGVSTAPGASADAPHPSVIRPPHPVEEVERGPDRWHGLLALAAAVAILAAAWSWFGADRPAGGDRTDVRTLPDAIELPWTATEDPAADGATGSVLWSDDAQSGLMTFRGLAVNDPSEYQYQLWIFDAGRDDAYPVDGGVFDVTGDVVEVSIDPKLGVSNAALFAVTVERPGGVVVSSRERIVLLAQVESTP